MLHKNSRTVVISGALALLFTLAAARADGPGWRGNTEIGSSISYEPSQLTIQTNEVNPSLLISWPETT